MAAGAEAAEVVRLYTELVGTLKPDILRFAIASETEIADAADPERLIAEVRERDAVLIGRGEIGCWARL